MSRLTYSAAYDRREKTCERLRKLCAAVPYGTPASPNCIKRMVANSHRMLRATQIRDARKAELVALRS